MKIANRIEIIKKESNRIDELIETYSKYDQKDLKDAVLRIQKRLGSERTNIAIQAISDKKWSTVCKSVLEYYDKCYDYEKIGKTNLKILDLSDLEDDNLIIKLFKEIFKD